MRAGDIARFAVIGLGTLTGPLDSAVNIAFPDITGSFGIPLQSIQWVVICYVLTYASLMLVFGRLGDLFGHHRIFRIGLLISTGAFLLCAAAKQYEWLLAFRILQGVGTAMVISCGPALVTGLFDEAARPKVLGAYMAMFGIGSAVGPSLGGLLVDHWGWAAVFWFRVPIAFTALLLTLALPMRPRARAEGGFDAQGAVLLVLALALLLLTFSQARNAGIGLLTVAILGAATLAAFAWFVMQQRRARAPIIALELFRNGAFAMINLTNVAVNFAGFSVLLLVPFFLVRTAALPASAGGLILASGALGMIAAAQIGGQIAGRFGAANVAAAGGLFVAAGIALIGFWPAEVTSAVMIACLLVHGVGLGLFQVSCLEVVTAIVPVVDRGVAGSLVMVTRTVGVVLAASLLTLLFVSLEGAALQAGTDNAFLEGFRMTFRYTAGFLFAFLLSTRLLYRRR